MPAIPGLLLLTTVAVAVDSRNRAKKAEAKQEELAAVERAQVSDRAARERRSQIRQARSQQALIENQAAASGQQSSSASIAAAAGVSSEASENIGAINNQVSFGNITNQLEQDIFKLQQPSDFQRAGQVVIAGLDIFTPKPKTE